ncbi:MAG: D-glycero-beta-D-manno-heptose 1-phosphate adenylyltransferase [Bacteroidota bacterium]
MRYTSANKILLLPDLLRRIASWRVKGEQVVFTNGCFDLIHLGHVDYLEKARALGDRLIIGLNSDRSVRLLKGERRPLLDEQARARVLAAMEFVDGLVLFEEETPYDLIRQILPNVLVKGADYAIEEIAGHDIVLAAGGKVERIELVQGYSTSNLLQRIRQA